MVTIFRHESASDTSTVLTENRPMNDSGIFGERLWNRDGDHHWETKELHPDFQIYATSGMICGYRQTLFYWLVLCYRTGAPFLEARQGALRGKAITAVEAIQEANKAIDKLLSDLQLHAVRPSPPESTSDPVN